MKTVPLFFWLATYVFTGVSATASFFQQGKEYVYSYGTAVSVGTDDYVHFTSVFNAFGKVHFLLQGNDVSVKFSDIQYGAKNGQYDGHSRNIERRSYEELNALTESFVITLYNGKVYNLTVSANTPEWARNIHRGLANAIQLDLAAITINTAESLTVDEHTILGNCKTDYTVIPESNVGGLRKTQVRKFRSHANCPDRPSQTVLTGNVGYCPDADSKNVLNSTLWSSFDLELENNVLTARKINQGSTVQYQPFGSRGLQQYSTTFTFLNLDRIIEGGNIDAPSNPINTDLKFVFDNSMTEDEDLTEPPPNFHMPATYAADIPTAQASAMAKLQAHIIEAVESLGNLEVFKDDFKVTTNDPLAGVAFMEVLNYKQLTQVYNELKAEPSSLKLKVFMDLLAFCGTGPSSLLVRDIVRNSKDPFTIARLLTDFSGRLRNPTEKIAQEFEAIVIQDPTTPLERINGRLLDLAFTSILNRACKRSGCKTSGLLDRYVKFYSDRFDNARGYQEKTAAVLALRNIGNSAAAQKLLDIFIEKHQDRSVRAQALPGVKHLTKDPNIINKNILRVFYDRSQHSELRTLAVDFSLMHGFTPELLNQVVNFMWSENCPFIRNYVYTLVKGISSSTLPCLEERASYARAALKYFPPWIPKFKYSGVYLSDYFDREFHFGKMTVLSVQRDGNDILPATLQFNVKSIIAGYEVTYITLFLRLEGLSSSVMKSVLAFATQAKDISDIKNIFAKIGIIDRTVAPLKLELTVMINKRVVTYIALDDRTIAGLQGLIRRALQSLLVPSETSFLRASQIASVMIERPNEFGIPVSIRSKVSSLLAFEAKTIPEKIDGGFRQDQQSRLQSHLFGETLLSNHFPALAMTNSVAAYRAFRYRLPRELHFSVDMKQRSLSFSLGLPKEDDPMLAVAGAASYTSFYRDGHLRFVSALPEIGTSAVKVTKGTKYSKSLKLLNLQKHLTGFAEEVEYLNCEKVNSKLKVFQQLGKIFGPENKNGGGKLITQLNLGLSNLLNLIFLSPTTPPCTLQANFHQDNNQSAVLQSVEGQLTFKPSTGNNTSGGISAESTMTLVYGGASRKTKTFRFLANSSNSFSLSSKEMSLKVIIEDEVTNKSSTICVDMTSESSPSTSLLGSDGDAEPENTRRVNIIYQPDIQNEFEGSCIETGASTSISYLSESRRSRDQIEDSAASQNWPFKDCQEDRQTKFPGPYNPPTSSCWRAAQERALLRESNVTINYRLEPKVQKRWDWLMRIISTILLPYEDTEETEDQAGGNDLTKGSTLEGQVKIDAHFDPESPTADIHVIGSQGKQLHYHNVDLSEYPFMRPVSVLAYSAATTGYFDLGLMGKCVVSSNAVETFDNATMEADLPECETLISGDCTSNPFYAIFAKKTGPNTIALELLLYGNTIKIGENGNVAVNGQTADVAIHETRFLDEKETISVTRFDDTSLKVSADTLGLQIHYTKYHVTLLDRSWLRGTSCGICGNFNSNRMDDNLGPDPSCGPQIAANLFKSYVRREGDCASVGSVCTAT